MPQSESQEKGGLARLTTKKAQPRRAQGGSWRQISILIRKRVAYPGSFAAGFVHYEYGSMIVFYRTPW